MNKLQGYLEAVIDLRQEKKVKHLMKDIILIVYFSKLSNANDWTEMYYFAVSNEEFLRKYLELPNGIPSHDTTCICDNIGGVSVRVPKTLE